MQKEIENHEFVQGVNFEINDSLKNNGTKYSLFFDDSCEDICNSKASVDIATAGRHRGLSTINMKHNLFHQSKLGRDVELQNTHIVLFKSPPDVMQVYPVFSRMHCKSAQGNLGSHYKTSSDKISRQGVVTIAKKNNLEAKKKRFVVRKRIATNSRHYTSRH